MKVTSSTVELHTRHPFGISRRTEQVFRNVLVEIHYNGYTGLGEAAPCEYYGETSQTVLAALPLLEKALGSNPFLMHEVSERLSATLGRNPSAKAALDIALHDLACKMMGIPLYQYFGLDPKSMPFTSYTISIGDPGLLEAKLLEASAFPVLKIKVGTEQDLATVEGIRKITDKTLRVDANGAWKAKEAVRMIRELSRFGIEFVEQPVEASDLEGLRFVRENVDVPVFADESVVSARDVLKLAGAVDGINIKLMKCGGIVEAMKMITVARALHMKIMLGCMIETSIGITASAQLAPLVDFADLDGNLLVENDPFRGVTITGGKLVLNQKPGLGVESPATPG